MMESIWQRSTTVRLLRWLFSKRVLKLALKISVIGILAIAAFYAQEDLLGYWTWKSYQSRKGITSDQLELRSYVPKALPDAQNFAATPVVKKWFTTKWDQQPWRSDHFSKAPSLLIEEIKDVEKKKPLRHLDLAAWYKGLTKETSTESRPLSKKQYAVAILTTLRDDEPAIESVRAASIRSKCSYPVDYTLEDPWQILLPHLSNIKELAPRLNLRACAELAAGASDKAFEDVLLILYLADSLKNDPLIVSSLVRASCVHAAVQPIWEGLVDHQWSDRQLQEIETRLLRFSFISEFERPLEVERAAGVRTIDLTKKRGVNYLARTAFNEPFDGLIGKAFDGAVPSGWFAREKVNYCRLWDILFTDVFDSEMGTISPADTDARCATFNRDVRYGNRRIMGLIFNHQLVGRLYLPTLTKSIFRAAIAQTAANQAVLACGLERYHLAKAKYPPDLQSLVPNWISAKPHDVIRDRDYIYRPMDSDRFTLYSVGWDETDDNGNPGEFLFARRGDWVWTSVE